MCGIAGWIDWSLDFTGENRESRRIMARMAAVQAHRGPDAEGEWFTKHAYLVHRRLIVIDPAGGRQPMVKTVEGRPYTLVYNGELYNTQALRASLQARGHRFHGHSDTEVLLTAYLEWGPAAVTRLNGIFAFAVWDEQRQELFLARDRMGVKPLFYTVLKNGLLFASELKALLVHPLVQPEVKIDGLAELLLLGPGRTPGHGIFAGVHELKPGYALTYNRGGLKMGPYWTINPAPHRDDPETTVHKVRALFDDTVRRQLISDVPICTLLPDEPLIDQRMRQLFYLNLTRWMPTLLDRKDRMSMYTGLEIRVPFCDHRLVEYVYNIPWALKNYKGQRKGILRAALKGLLPAEVCNRPKNPYPKTFHPEYFKGSRQLILDLLARPNAPLFYLVHRPALLELASRPEELSKPWFGQLMGLPQLFIYLVQLNLWLEKYHVKLCI